eukprot:1836522-Prymnesium_polylepis.1
MLTSLRRTRNTSQRNWLCRSAAIQIVGAHALRRGAGMARCVHPATRWLPVKCTKSTCERE